MSFAILRVAKIKTAGGAGALSAHIERTMDVPNSDEELRHYNKRHFGSGDLWHDIKQKLNDNGITEVRKNGVYALEFLMTASPEHFNFHKVRNEDGSVELKGIVKNWHEFQKKSASWLAKEFGKDNIVNFTTHFDEQSPHIHAVVMPITQGKNGKKKLSAKSFIDGREKLRALQDSFAEVHKESGLKRGLEGSKAKHTTVKEFYASIKDNPSLKDETLKLINQRANKKETLTEKRLAKLEKIIKEDFGHRCEWDAGKDSLFIINIELEKQEKAEQEARERERKIKEDQDKEKQIQMVKNQSIFSRGRSI